MFVNISKELQNCIDIYVVVIRSVLSHIFHQIILLFNFLSSCKRSNFHYFSLICSYSRISNDVKVFTTPLLYCSSRSGYEFSNIRIVLIFYKKMTNSFLFILKLHFLFALYPETRKGVVLFVSFQFY